MAEGQRQWNWLQWHIGCFEYATNNSLFLQTWIWWFYGWLTRLNGNICVSSSHLDPLHGAVPRADSIYPFYYITTCGVGLARPGQRETSLCVNCPGHSKGFCIWKEKNTYTVSPFCLFICSNINTLSFHFHIPVKRRGMTTLAGWDDPAAFFAMIVAMILSLLKAAFCVKLTGAAVVPGKKICVCCTFPSVLQRVTS